MLKENQHLYLWKYIRGPCIIRQEEQKSIYILMPYKTGKKKIKNKKKIPVYNPNSAYRIPVYQPNELYMSHFHAIAN
jgi:hypothetical protein